MIRAQTTRSLSLLLLLLGGADPAPAPFEQEIRAFEQADAKNPPPQNAVLFVGSSSIRLWKTLAEDFPDLTIINRGFGGSQVEDSVRYADRIVLSYRPKAIVFYAGDNDIAAGKSPQRVLADFKTFVEKVHTTLPGTPVLYIAVKPSIARWHLHGKIWLTNRLLREFADGHDKVDFVDVYTPALDSDGKPRADLLVEDRLHLNARGYELWTRTLRPQLDRAMAPPDQKN
jgi:lysophospholipase L1-like esterase